MEGCEKGGIEEVAYFWHFLDGIMFWLIGVLIDKIGGGVSTE